MIIVASTASLLSNDYSDISTTFYQFYQPHIFDYWIKMGKYKGGIFCSGNKPGANVYASEFEWLEKHGFDCGGYKDTSTFNETLHELSNYIMRTGKLAPTEVAKTVRTMHVIDQTPPTPSTTNKA